MDIEITVTNFGHVTFCHTVTKQEIKPFQNFPFPKCLERNSTMDILSDTLNLNKFSCLVLLIK